MFVIEFVGPDLLDPCFVIGECNDFDIPPGLDHVRVRHVPRLTVSAFDITDPAICIEKTHTFRVAWKTERGRAIPAVVRQPGDPVSILPGWRPAGADNLWWPEDDYPEEVGSFVIGPDVGDEARQKARRDGRFRKWLFADVWRRVFKMGARRFKDVPGAELREINQAYGDIRFRPRATLLPDAFNMIPSDEKTAAALQRFYINTPLTIPKHTLGIIKNNGS